MKSDLISYDGPDAVVRSNELDAELRTVKLPPRIKHGMDRLDGLLGGIAGGEVYVVSGPTANGKTLLCETLTAHFAEANVPCLWFEYEVPVRQFLSQFGSELPVFALPRKLIDRDFNWLKTRIQEAIAKYAVKIVFIDHLHYVIDIFRTTQPSLDIGIIMRRLKKDVAEEFDISVFLLVHQKKMDEDREPDTGDVRDSSFIEAEADRVFYIWRVKEKGTREGTNEAVVKITKDRPTGVMNKRIRLIKNGPYFKEIPAEPKQGTLV